ncbi:MAG: PIN domain-containing protein [Desulfurococcales archaeon]|nr:PIN domain-containing protein [Desulfurococcales archaeon]
MIREQGPILLDSRALAWLHAEGRNGYLKLVLSRFDVYVSALSIYELASALLYYRLSDPVKTIQSLEKIYHIIYLDKEILATAARIDADLTYKGVKHNNIDAIVVATAIKYNMPLITTKTSIYDDFKPYGITVVAIDKLIKATEERLKKEIKKLSELD